MLLRVLALVGLASILFLVACEAPTPTPTPSPTPTTTPTPSPTPTATATPTATPSPTPAPDRTRAEAIKLVYDEVYSRYWHQLDWLSGRIYDLDDQIVFEPAGHLKELMRREMRWLEAYQADVEACSEALEGDIEATWDPENRLWRVSYAIGEREVVYHFFERLEAEGKNAIELVDGCQTVPVDYQDWDGE